MRRSVAVCSTVRGAALAVLPQGQSPNLIQPPHRYAPRIAFPALVAAADIRAPSPPCTGKDNERGISLLATGLLALLATSTVLLGLTVAGAAETRVPPPVARIGSTEKICQLTGDLDWETGRPTAARTLSNFGLDAVDLGYPVEHDGKLILLFGDS